MKLKRKLSLILCTCLAGLSLCSCAEKDEVLDMTVILKSQGVEFWDTVLSGAYDAGDELDIEIKYNAPPTEADIDLQIEMIQTAIDNNTDAIILAPLDTEKLNPVLMKATEAGIPIITIDSTVTYSQIEGFVGTQNRVAGAIASRQCAEIAKTKNKANVLVVYHMEGIQTSIERTEGFIDEVKQNYPDMNIAGSICGENNTEIARQKVTEEIQKNPDINIIYATNETVAIGVCEAVAQAGLEDEIDIIGFDSSVAEISYLEKEILNGMIVQNPYNFGYLGVRNAHKAINGESIDSVIDTGVTYVTLENYNDADVYQLLYPSANKEG